MRLLIKNTQGIIYLIRFSAKITGMIVELGNNEMMELYNNPKQLDKVVDDAYAVNTY
jgi:hypothetical protein